uniref:EGF like domain multiple 7 n=1 Tax=Apteryx owenii TaxID=8824 RepID=A0A8B9PI18_APTOW
LCGRTEMVAEFDLLQPAAGSSDGCRVARGLRRSARSVSPVPGSAEPRSRPAAVPESHVQPVYQPYLTTCQGQRLCSTYRTIYKVAYRQAYRQVPRPAAPCCPGWTRSRRLPGWCGASRAAALCWVPCRNGGSCAFPGRCACPPGWTGAACETDVDECARRSHGCSQLCINTAGSYRCACRPGFRSTVRGAGSLPSTFRFVLGNGFLLTGLLLLIFSGPSSEMKEEMKDLKNRVEALEQKLQLVLAPFHNLMPSAPDDVDADPISRLSHSLQQLDRIDSLSEQISFLEERLETCKCPGKGGF